MQLDPVAAVVLGLVDGCIGVTEQVVETGMGALLTAGHSETAGNFKLDRVEVLQRTTNGFGFFQRLPLVAMTQQDNKFLASEAGHDILFATLFAQQLSGFLKHPVT